MAAVGSASSDTNEQQKLQQRHPLPWLNLLVAEPFYLMHFLTFFSYLAARSSALQDSDLAVRLIRREILAVFILSVYVAVKMVKEESWEGFITDTLFYAKGFLLAVSLLVDYHLALCYLFAYLVIFLMAQQPSYDGLGDSSQLTPLQLEAILTEGNTSRFWLVEFRTTCSPTCVRTSRFLPDLSIIYSNNKISFGIVDIGLFPNTAEKFGIYLGVGSSQLPTYILFDNAVEVARFPDSTSEVRGPTTLSKSSLCRYFELDRHLIGYMHGK